MNRDVGTNGSPSSRRHDSSLGSAVRRLPPQIHSTGRASTDVEEGVFDQLECKEAIIILAMTLPGRDTEKFWRIGSRRGWEVLMANDWEEGLQLLSLRKTGVILVDRRLIEPDWQDSLRMLLRPNRTLCVVLISPTADDSFWEDVIRQGGYDVLKTPLDEKRVIETTQFAWKFWRVCTGAKNGI